jgi:outer membrane PBP1 activator LpoA protein
MTRNQPKAALTALSHPSLQRLSEMPPNSRSAPAPCTPAPWKPMARPWPPLGARLHRPMLNGDAASKNHEAIWALIASLPADQLQASRRPRRLDGLALAVKSAGTLEQQQAAIDTWRAQNPAPGRYQLPLPLTKLKELASQP